VQKFYIRREGDPAKEDLKGTKIENGHLKKERPLRRVAIPLFGSKRKPFSSRDWRANGSGEGNGEAWVPCGRRGAGRAEGMTIEGDTQTYRRGRERREGVGQGAGKEWSSKIGMSRET